MPTKPPHACSHPGCNVITPHRYCNRHHKQHQESNWSRTSRASRGYGPEWDRVRKLALERDRGLCLPCAMAGRRTRATEVDHVIPKAAGGSDQLHNLQSICRSCHANKTYQDAKMVRKDRGRQRPD